MAVTDINLGSGQISDTTLNTIYTVTSTVARGASLYSLVLTNTTANIITVDIYLNDGTDRLFKTVKIPAGSGNALNVKGIPGVTLSQNQIVKLQASSSDAFNYKLNGSQRT